MCDKEILSKLLDYVKDYKNLLSSNSCTYYDPYTNKINELAKIIKETENYIKGDEQFE